MHKFLIILVAGSLGTMASAGAANTTSTAIELSPERLFEKLSSSVYVVLSYDRSDKALGQGSAVVIGKERMVTNCHVIAKAARIVVKRRNTAHQAQLEFPDPDRDLCQLKVEDLRAEGVPIAASSSLKIGQKVYAIGNPKGLELSLSDGLISSLRKDDGSLYIQTTAPISPGSSGGGLFDAAGRLLGITTFVHKDKDAQNLNFAIPAEWIHELPERGAANLAKVAAPKTASTGAAPAIPSLPPKDLILPHTMPQVGDTWTYSLVDQRYRPNDRSRRFTHRIATVSAGQIVEVVNRTDGSRIAETRFDSGIRAYLRLGVLELAPFLGVFNDLQVGHRWREIPIDGSIPLGAIGSQTVAPFVVNGGRAIGEESITVPAGVFDAVRVELWGTAMEAALGTVANGWSGMRSQPFTLSAWYAVKAKRLVRLVVQSPATRDVYELEEYSLR